MLVIAVALIRFQLDGTLESEKFEFFYRQPLATNLPSCFLAVSFNC